MATAFEIGRAAWPALALSEDQFERYLEERAVPPGSPHLGDLYLACACAHEVPGALSAFDGLFMPRVSDFLARLRPTGSFVDDVSQLVRERLFVGASKKILEYSGRGPLAAWLRVVVVRTALNLKRLRGEEGQRELDPERDLLGAAASPESQMLRLRYRPLFADAFAEALTALSTDERNLLRLHYVDGLAMDELCRLFKVTRSTIYRRLEACTRTLLERMRDQLGERLGLSAPEFDSLANVVKSDLDVSLGGLLRSVG